jgi:hypothetical protein
MIIFLFLLFFPYYSVQHCTGEDEYQIFNNHCTYVRYVVILTASVVKWSEFLATDPEVSGSIPGATRFSEK